jgi:hypothetical protein
VARRCSLGMVGSAFRQRARSSDWAEAAWAVEELVEEETGRFKQEGIRWRAAPGMQKSAEAWAQALWQEEADKWAPRQENFEIKINLVFNLGLQLNSKQIPKNLVKFLEVGNQI